MKQLRVPAARSSPRPTSETPGKPGHQPGGRNRKRRLLREVLPDPVAPSGAARKSAAGLALLTVLVAFVPSMTHFNAVDRSGSYRGGSTPSTTEAGRAAAHRKAIFDERRARFERDAPPRVTGNSIPR
ncbi:MAG: hypothetical protein ABI885_27280 [Gammaproteobacteria bacterium]